MPLQPEVDGVPVTWATVLDVPSGGNGVVSPSAWELEILTVGALGDTWELRANGSAFQHLVGSGSWVLTILTPGLAGTTWSATVNGQTAQYVVQALDTAALVAAGLELAIEGLTGVASSALGAAITIVLDSGANFIPTASTTGAGTHTLSGVAGKDTPTEVAAALADAFDVDGLTCTPTAGALAVEPDVAGTYVHATLSTDGTGTLVRSLTGTPTGFDPQPTPN